MAKSLAGTCGIPREEDRVYIGMESTINHDANGTEYEVLRRVIWPDGRSWKIDSTYHHQTYGRSFFGNLVERWEVCIMRQRKTIWREHGEFFVAKKRAKESGFTGGIAP